MKGVCACATYTTSLSCSSVSGAGFISTYEMEFCWSFNSSTTEIGGYNCHSNHMGVGEMKYN